MAKIFSGLGRVGAARVVDPFARRLLKAGIGPNVVTVTGTFGVFVGAIAFGARGKWIIATVFITLTALTDLLDGAMARAMLAQGAAPRRFGAFLDSTMDRLADGVIFASVAYWFGLHGRPVGCAAALVCLVAGQVVSYAKARAEGLGMTANVGFAERAERLIIVGVGALLQGLGVPHALTVALSLLAALSLFTVGQRMAHVYRQDQGS